MTRIVQEQNVEKQHIEKQMGCMAGFLQIFDRPHVLSGKRLYGTKGLPPSVVTADSSTEPEKSIESPAISRELEKQHNTRSMPSPERFKQSPVSELRTPVPEVASPVEVQSKMSFPVPAFELKEGAKSSRKFCKEAPRLSLDSRATFDATKGSLKPKKIRTNAAIFSANRYESNGEESDASEKQHRSPSVVARLMGLEILPDSDTEEAAKPQLRRSASESRASRDLLQYRFIDGINFQLRQPQLQNTKSNVMRDFVVKDQIITNNRAVNVTRNASAETARTANTRGMVHRKSFFDSADFFPEPKHAPAVSAYGEIERRLRSKGIEEPSKDLETLKQILEALQLKGLLHSEKHPYQFSPRNFVYNSNFSVDESPIVVMKPARTMSPVNRPGRMGNDSPSPTFRARPAVRRDSNLYSESLPAMSPKRYRPEIEHNARKQTSGRSSCLPSESRVNSPNRRRPLSVETQRRASNDLAEQRRLSPVQSPKLSSRRAGLDHTTNRTSRNGRQMVEKVLVPTEEESSTISESSFSASSQTDTERPKAEDYREGRNLLERCDKLLHSIAEMTATELQPSPVSVLDSSFYKEESSPSPVMKRSIDFQDQFLDFEDEIWSPGISSFQYRSEDDRGDADFTYISDIIRAFNCLPGDADVFLLLEKQRCLEGRDASKVSTLQRKLTFDTITEILNRRKQLPPWKAISWGNSADGHVSIEQVWSEFRRIRERDAAEDSFEVICGVLKKDLAGDATNGWGDCPIEVSDVVLDIERLIFRDLIGETIRDVAAFAPKCSRVAVSRRKLGF
uniref:Protein LONGIFOLIA 1 n=1 Tax=Rhizophora mucronata TaxID=61149 RepID=A0A2P2QNI3_RHIMU